MLLRAPNGLPPASTHATTSDINSSQRVDSLLKEAWRLRFLDRDRERRFDESRLTSATIRVRITIGLGLVVLAGTGLMSFLEPSVHPELQMQAWLIRYLMCVPLWLMLFLTTWSRHFRERMDAWLSPAIPVTCALFTWESITLASLPAEVRAPVLLGVNVLPILMVSALAIPFRFRWLISAVVLSVALPTSMVSFWQPSLDAAELAFGALNMAGFGICILVAGWWREAMERRLFAQREAMESTNLELERVNHELQRLNEEKNEFMALAAHDLRSPLAAVRGLAEILSLQPEPPREERADAVREVAETTDRMLGIVSNFLDVHAVETGQISIRIQPVDLAAAARGAIERHAAIALRKSQGLALECSGAAEFPVLVDAALLAQIQDNLLSNALKFSPAGTRILVSIRLEGDSVVTEISDSGPGFSDEDLSQVFRKFTRLSARPTAGESSTGLGLALAKRFVEAMGGSIAVANSPEGGAKVSVRLKAAPPNTSEPPG